MNCKSNFDMHTFKVSNTHTHTMYASDAFIIEEAHEVNDLVKFYSFII